MFFADQMEGATSFESALRNPMVVSFQDYL